MPNELLHVVRRLLDVFDEQDFAASAEMFSADAQGIDEISRRWMRSGAEIDAYFKRLGLMLTAVHTELIDMTEVVWEDTGIVTCWLEQDYVLEGKPDHVSAPTTFVLHREGGEWKVALVHSVPLPSP